jgi:hypothetical protein
MDDSLQLNGRKRACVGAVAGNGGQEGVPDQSRKQVASFAHKPWSQVTLVDQKLTFNSISLQEVYVSNKKLPTSLDTCCLDKMALRAAMATLRRPMDISSDLEL